MPFAAFGAERIPRQPIGCPPVLAARAAVRRPVPVFAAVQVQVEEIGRQTQAARQRPVPAPTT